MSEARCSPIGRVLLAAIAIAGLLGCGSVEPLPDDHYYRLTAGQPPAPREVPALAGTLQVGLPTATGIRRSRAILYSPAPHVRFQEYHYHHWEESPPQLVQHRLVDGLRASGVAERVTDRGTERAQHRLESHLARFERLLDGETAAALIELHVRLVAPGAGGAPSLERVYRVRKPAAGLSMEATAIAFSQAMDDVVRSLAEDLAP